MGELYPRLAGLIHTVHLHHSIIPAQKDLLASITCHIIAWYAADPWKTHTWNTACAKSTYTQIIKHLRTIATLPANDETSLLTNVHGLQKPHRTTLHHFLRLCRVCVPYVGNYHLHVHVSHALHCRHPLRSQMDGSKVCQIPWQALETPFERWLPLGCGLHMHMYIVNQSVTGKLWPNKFALTSKELSFPTKCTMYM